MLPASIVELIGVIGEHDTFTLVEKYGGTTLYFSIHATTLHYPIHAKSVPEELSQKTWHKLCKHYSGGYLFIPKCQKMLLARRNNSIKAARVSGKSIAQCALEFKLSDRQITTICNSNKQGNNQYDLFSI